MMTEKKIAILPPNRLGDGLLSMVLANNLFTNGYEVTTFNNYIYEMQSWFPNQHIQPFPKLAHIDELMQGYHKVISIYSNSLQDVKHNLGNKYQVLRDVMFDKDKTLLWNILQICKKYFAIANPVPINDCQAPANLEKRKFITQVIIHPSSTDEKKNWPAEKFIALAEALKKMQYEPVFIVNSTERGKWQAAATNLYGLPLFTTMDKLANFVYESGYMIGNDSGIGHLASNLGLPTLSLFGRKSVSKVWRPAFGNGAIIVPFQLPGATMQMKYWKYFVSVRKVLATFEKQLKE